MLERPLKIKAMEIASMAEEPVESEPEPETDIYQEEAPWGYTEETPPTPKERKTSNVVLVILAVFLLAFIVAMTVIFCVKGSVPDTLIQYTMGAGGIEALLLAGIKISKVVTGNKSGSDPSDWAE